MEVSHEPVLQGMTILLQEGVNAIHDLALMLDIIEKIFILHQPVLDKDVLNLLTERGSRMGDDNINGMIVVVEKEQKNSPDDMETITMWADMSSRVADVRIATPLWMTSETLSLT